MTNALLLAAVVVIALAMLVSVPWWSETLGRRARRRQRARNAALRDAGDDRLG